MSMADHVIRVQADLGELGEFYNIDIAPRRYEALEIYHENELELLTKIDFDGLDQEGKVDYIMLRTFHTRQLNNLDLQKASQEKFYPLLPFADDLIGLLEARQDVEPMKAKETAKTLNDITKSISEVQTKVEGGKFNVTETTGYLASKAIKGLLEHFAEWFTFYSTYDPLFDFWVTTPWQTANSTLSTYLTVVETKLAGMNQKDGKDAIIGEPIGRKGLEVELEAEMIPYTPEELIEIGNQEFEWCEKEMIKQSEAMGYGKDWKKALDHVKNDYMDPGKKTELVRELVVEGSLFVTERDLVTVPPLANSTWRMSMIEAERQKVSPFFLGGPTIQVSYPVVSMEHDLKLMVMRGNNKHFARATAFHEMFPGHRLQLYMADRYNSHRRYIFDTPFFVEGWALYWEMLFYARDDFHHSPEGRIGALWWRMHRCLRIIFSLKFHLGEMTAQEAVDLLVDRIAHERSNAEGEVRRSVEGSYSPLYQAGYMLGALQLWKLRGMVVDTKELSEKEYHDAILKTGMLPIEMVKALITGDELSRDFKPEWKFYDFD
ncbi:hypothetical protein NW754_009376 [Fusarium falciforme]|uniref:X-Pro dipeptidyl-peptidase n=1 Tax=Fusarium falciforme TaxID=195108 RepID=A0A9W8V0V7_9HYPO|nr:hypothetical protein NW754_009376 [Fusarium falciforme]KAJ4185760.1 hypothetical protein NW755_008211 [Fusarium falciforme]KAJ4206864.1 hypothetical protein NW767_003157 [Fusarium falciforme]KAJ4260802.1 hypothetical protein NW757_001185 [Fusarium falciforme]